MEPVVLDIVARRAPRPALDADSTDGSDRFEIRLQDGAWTPFAPPADADWVATWAAFSSGDLEAGRALGERLAARLDLAGWSACAPRLVRAIAQGQGLRLRVRAPSDALLALPWRFLPLTPGGEAIGSYPAIRVQLAWEGGGSSPRSALSVRARRRGTERLSCASARPPGRSDRLATILRKAATAGGLSFAADRDRLDLASLEAIDHHLRVATQHQQPVTLLHLEAALQPGESGAHLVLWEASGAERLVGPARLEELLRKHNGTLRMVVLTAVGNQPGVDVAPLVLAAHRAGIEVVVGARWPLSDDGARAFAESFYDGLLARGLSVEASLVLAREALAAADLPGDAAGLMLCAHTAAEHHPLVPRPWPGLAPYTRNKARLLAGRGAEVDRIEAAFQRLEAAGAPAFLALSAPRGSGLRSLARAGVAPRLEAGGTTVLASRPGPPLPARSGKAPQLIIASSFDALFHELRDDDAGRRAWLGSLWARAAPGSGDRVLLLIPGELLGRCAELVIDDSGRRLDALISEEAHHRMVPAPGPDALREMITVPAAAVGLNLEDGLVDIILEDLAEAGQPLPRLSQLMAGLWEDSGPGGARLADYRLRGGVAEALARRPEQLWAELDPALQPVLEQVLLRMVRLQPGQPPYLPAQSAAALAEETGLAPEAIDAVLAALDSHELILPAGPGAHRLAAPALVAGWPRLHGWLVAQGGAPGSPTVAPTGRPLRQWLILAAVLLLTPLFVGLGRAWAGREQAEAALAAHLDNPLADPTATAVGLRQLRQPEDPEAWRAAAQLALGEPLAALVVGPLAAPPAMVRFRGDGRTALVRAGEQLYRVDLLTGETAELPLQEAVVAATPAPDGPGVLAVDRDGVLWRWSPDSPPQALYRAEESGPAIAAFSPSGDVALVVRGGAWVLLDPRGGLLSEGPVPLNGDVVRTAAVADGGLRQVIASQAGTVLFWAAGQEDPARLRHPGVRRLRLNPDGSFLLSLGDGRMWLTDLVRGTGVSRTPADVRVEAAEFDSTGDWLAVDYTELSTGAHRSRRVNVTQRAEQHESEAFPAASVSLRVEAQAQRVWRGLADGTVEERDLENGDLLRVLRGHHGRVHLVSASPDGRWLATGANDGTLRFWPLTATPPTPLPEAEDALRSALWTATRSCAGLDAAGAEAFCACERCQGREPERCDGVPGGLRGLVARVTPDSSCPL